MKNPLQWTVQRLIVREEADAVEIEDAAMAMQVHLVSVGQMGVGKSKFLCAFARGGQNEFGEDLFKSGVDPAGGMASVKKKFLRNWSRSITRIPQHPHCSLMFQVLVIQQCTATNAPPNIC